MKRPSKIDLFVFVAVAVSSMSAAAEAPAPKDWGARVTPYLWLSAINGTMSGTQESADIAIGIDDVLANLGGGLMGAGEIRYRRFLLLADFMWARLTPEVTADSVTVGPGPIGVQVGPAEVDITFNQVTALVAGGYRVLDLPFPRRADPDDALDPRRIQLDAFMGARFWWLGQKNDIDIPPASIGGMPVPGTGRDVEINSDDWWVDMQLGVALGLRPWERWSIGLGGAVGGFDIGSSSKFSWSGILDVNWHFGEKWTLNLAYRGIGFNRDFVSGASTLNLDIAMHGPLLGFTRQF